ncbi:MAG: class I SAM-dependent methyltransferase [Clostridia bacterium]|nr:class I SAM-dependent methyltransferase [Clostridia bacterium]
MGLLNKFFNQTRKPEGFLGKVMLSGMNGGGHASLADFGMANLPKTGINRIAELGCGGGRNIDALLKKYDKAFVTGVDYSPLSVEKAIAFNKKNADRCEIRQGDVSKLDLEKGKFDLATAFETVYFWPGLKDCFRNVFDVLKEGGYFLVVNESDGKDESGKKFEKIIDGMKVYTSEEIGEALKEAGFKEVKAFCHDKKPWIAVLAQK